MELIDNVKEQFNGMNGITKVAIGVIILLMFMGLTSAEVFTFDNVKSYDAVKQEITITNTFGLGEDIAKIKLNTPLINYVPYGKDRKIAEFQLINYENYNNVLEKIDTYNTNNLKEKIGRTFNYKIITYEEVINIDKNGTEKKEIKEIQTPIEKMDFLKGDVYTIGIFTDVYMGDNIEWIPTFYGKEINEWAGWVSDNIIINGLNVPAGSYPFIDVFFMDETWYTLVGIGTGVPLGQKRLANGTWVINSTISTGFFVTGGNFKHSINTFKIGSSYYSIEGYDNGTAFGYKWSGTAWAINSTISTGLVDGGSTFTASVFNKDSSIYLIAGITNGFNGYVWNGAGWTANNTITGGLPSSSGSRKPSVFKDNLGIFHMIDGVEGDGLLYGYTYNQGTLTWEIDLLVNESLPDVGTQAYPSVFNLTPTEFYLIVGNGAGASGFNKTYTPILPTPKVTLNSPINYFNTTNPTITFNITATDKQLITNVTLYIDGVINQTDTSGTNGTYIFTKTLSEGSHNWNILAYNNNSQSNQSNTRYLTIDDTNPIINITNPLNTIYIDNYATTDNNTIFLNYSISDTHLSNCWYSNDGGSSNISISACGINKTFYLLYGSYNYIVWANDTFGLLGSDYVSFTLDYKLFENSISYQSTTLEGTNETYTFNFNKSSSLTISTVQFIYNNVSYISPYSTSANYQTINKYFTVPTVASDTNYTFYWSVLFSDGVRVNSSFHTQQVNNLGIDNCGAFTEHAFNFTLLDEEAQTLLNGSIEANIQVYSSDGVTSLANYSTYINNTGYLQICIGNTTTNPNYFINGVIKYKEPTHATEYYNFVNFNYVNATKYSNISLYDLASADSTEFQIIFKDENFISLPDVLIYVNREYISESTFKTVELPKTDSGGQTIVHLVRNDINYNLIAVKDGVILATFNNLRAFCEDYTIGNCKLYLTATSQSFATYNYSGDTGISSSLDYDNSTKIITFSFVSINATSKNINMVVWRNNYFGNTSFCNTSLTSASGSLTCNISSIANTDTTIRIEVYVNGEQILDEYIDFTDREGSKDYYFLFFIFIFAFVLMFIDDKTTMIVGVLIGFATAFGLGLLKGKMIGLASAGIFLIIVAIIMVWKLNKEKRQ